MSAPLAPDLSAAYGVPIRCPCDALTIQRLLEALYAARAVRGLCVRVETMAEGLVAVVVVHEPTVPTKALLDAVISGSPVRPLVFATLWTGGAKTAAGLAAALTFEEAAVQEALASLARLGLVVAAGEVWTARQWARGGEA